MVPRDMHQTILLLPLHLRRLRDKTFSVYVANLPKDISKAELEGLFFRAGKIADIFIPVEKGSRESRGFAFVHFDTKREAEKAVDIADRRLWRGRKIKVNIALYRSKGEMDKEADKFRMSTKGDNRTYLEALLGAENSSGSTDTRKGEGKI